MLGLTNVSSPSSVQVAYLVTTHSPTSSLVEVDEEESTLRVQLLTPNTKYPNNREMDARDNILLIFCIDLLPSIISHLSQDKKTCISSYQYYSDVSAFMSNI